MEPPQSLGLVAGDGCLPREIARAASEKGCRVVAVALEGFCDPGLEQAVDSIHWVALGQVETLVDLFAREGLRDAVFAGGIRGALMPGDGRLRLDARALTMLEKLENMSDDSIFGALVDELERNAIAVQSQADWVPHLVARPGMLGEGSVTPQQGRDSEFGFRVVRSLGRLGVGQCAIVRRGRVLALEAIEGTDAAIRRAGEWGAAGAVVVKAARPHQDLRFDLPAVGLGTLEAMRKAEATVLAFEAGRTLLLDPDEMIRRARTFGIALLGIACEDAPEAPLKW